MTAEATLRLRNVTTGEIKDVVPDSDEFVDLKAEVYDHQGSQRPKWEQTGDHHARRLDADESTEADHGYDDKPLVATLDPEELAKIGPEVNPHLELSPAEVELGLTKEDKAKQIADEGYGLTEESQERKERAEKRVGTERKGQRRGRGKAAPKASSGSGSGGS